MQPLDTLPKEACVIIFPGKNNNSAFPFDNTKSHMTYALDTLVAKNMNLSSARKQEKICSTLYFYERIKYDQSMIFQLDYYIPELCEEAKGLKQVLTERGLWPEKGLKLKEAQELMS
ncbi:34817_t:CDS:2 [Gigaspora margarita]|uniref:34817_t:CDS:1 n=1 Tax=Gigaspora margarita TaxID=4874 RepID=A0ABN7VXE6_GIGMA|nr:34817_t:CDS:2 [Gigaspora margarita]